MEYDRIFFQDGYHLARGILDQEPIREGIIKILESAYTPINGLIISFRRRCKKTGSG